MSATLKMAGQNIRCAAICLLLCFLAGQTHAAVLSAADWVTNARQATPSQFVEKHVVTVDDNCGSTIQKGDISLTAGTAGGTPEQAVSLKAGVGVVLEFCSGATKAHIFKSPDFFESAAIWKVESLAGYVEGDNLVECQANPNSCCTVYMVPVAAKPFQIEVETCPSKTVAVNVLPGTTMDTLAPADPIITGTLSTSAPIEVEISLVFRPDCGLGTPSTEGADGVYEGTGENSAEGADGIYEGTGESQSPSPTEGADGIYEGTGESQSPSPDEGADGIYEGNGESQAPSPNEGDDGIYEGNGESQSPPTPEGADGIYEGTGEGSTEGADGIYEGTGESQGTPPTPEGADGIYEGTGESQGTPPTPEGADGIYEGTGESQSPPAGRRLMQSENDAPASEYPGTKWFWSKGHSLNKNSLIDPAAPIVGESVESGEGADGVYEGTGESGAPPTPEGADGIYEGTGESQGAPPTPEGADGIYEGTGESQGAPPTPEGADGIYEGTGESQGAPPTPEGADGIYEGTGESQGAPPTPEGADGIYEGTGESQGAPPTPEGADGIYEGTGESQSPPAARRLLWRPHRPARALLDASTGVPMYDASTTPIELVAGTLYKIKVNLVRAPQAAYFSAPDFFKTCLVHHVEDAGAAVEFERLRDVEVYQGSPYWAIEVQPMTPGTYTFSSNADGPDGFTGTIKVVGSLGELSNSTTFATTDVSIAPCSVAGGNGTSTEASGAAGRGLTVLGSILAAVVVAVALL